jgi:hypothetical protein
VGQGRPGVPLPVPVPSGVQAGAGVGGAAVPTGVGAGAGAGAGLPGTPMPTPRLPLVPWSGLTHLRYVGKGAFGDVAMMEWSARGLTVAVKCNGVDCVNSAAIDNERELYELLLTNPHDNILPVYGICTDAPDAKTRLVMRFCEKGSLDSHLTARAKPEVGVTPGG